MPNSVLAKTSGLAWVLLESYAIDPLPLFRELHIDPDQMHDVSARMAPTTALKLWKGVAERVSDPCFGLKMGHLWHPSYMHALGYAWMSSSSLRTALDRLTRYIHIVNQSIEVNLHEDEKRVRINVVNTFEGRDEYWDEDGSMAIVLTMCRAHYGKHLDPLEATFIHEKPACAGDFYEFFRCPVRFGASETSLSLAIEDVDKRLPGDNPLLAQVIDQEMIRYLARLNKNDIVQRVKAAIIDMLPDGRISDARVADALFMSARKLQRKLHEEGTTFKTLLTEVRKELALKYIKDQQLTLTEMSFQLGFSEMSSFSRAFKQWTGKSPREFRQTA